MDNTCVTCREAQIHESLSMHCWDCFTKRFEEDKTIDQNPMQIQELKDYMSSILDKIEQENSNEVVNILLNELATWKIWQVTNNFPINHNVKSINMFEEN